MNGNIWADYPIEEARLREYPGVTPERRAEMSSLLQRTFQRGSAGAGLGLGARAGMVDPYAHAQQLVPVRERVAQMAAGFKEEEERRKYMQMIEEARQRVAREGELAGTLGGIGSIIGGFAGGTGGARIGASLGTVIGGLF